MPRKPCRAPADPQLNLPPLSQASPALVDDTRESAREAVPSTLVSALSVSPTHRRRGRPRIFPRNTSSEHSPHAQLASTEPVAKDHKDVSTTAALTLAVSNSTSTEAPTANSSSVTGASTRLPLSLPLASVSAPSSSSGITDALPHITVASPDTRHRSPRTVTASSPTSLHSSAQTVPVNSESIAADGTDGATPGALPPLPSPAAFMAACFGWRLTRCAFDEHAKMTFVLQHRTATTRHVAIESSEGALRLAGGVTGDANSGTVRVNGILMSFTQCAAYLQDLTHRAPTLFNSSQPVPPTDQMPLGEEERSDTLGEGESISSPIFQLPSPASPNELAKRFERQARKRARSCSPSPHARSTTSVTSATELLSGATGMSLSDEPVTAGGERRKGSLMSPPSSSPASSFHSTHTQALPETAIPVSMTAPGIKVEAQPSQFATAPVTHRQRDDRGTRNPRAQALSVAAIKGSESSWQLQQKPNASDTNTGDTNAASQRDVLVANGSVSPREKPISSTVFASPTMRQRRTFSTHRVGAAGAGTASPVVGAHHSPPTSHVPPHGAPRTGTFTMPFAFRHVSVEPFVLGAVQEEPNVVGSKGTSCGAHPSAWSDSGGWSTCSSQFWLAHTHAVSRAFGVTPALRSDQSASSEDPEPLERGDAVGQRTEKVASAFFSVAPTDSQTVAALVRMTLRAQWRQRSSMWATMEDSLRMAVGSGCLRGDALEAGVHALQASGEEQCRYSGIDAEADLRGIAFGSSGMTVPTVGWVGHTAERLPSSSFPASRPRALLPVSGRAVVEAQDRITDNDEGRREEGARQPRYVACTGGIPSADRISIDHTYSTRGSYVMAPHVTAEGTATSPCGFLALKRNPQEDLHHHVYKRVMPTDMRLAVEAEDSLTAQSNAIASPRVSDAMFSASFDPRRGVDGGECDDDDEEENDGRANGSVRKVCSLLTSTRGTRRAPAAVDLLGSGRGNGSADIDYILRNHPSIRRIPMPDVELRYGP